MCEESRRKDQSSTTFCSYCDHLMALRAIRATASGAKSITTPNIDMSITINSIEAFPIKMFTVHIFFLTKNKLLKLGEIKTMVIMVYHYSQKHSLRIFLFLKKNIRLVKIIVIKKKEVLTCNY